MLFNDGHLSGRLSLLGQSSGARLPQGAGELVCLGCLKLGLLTLALHNSGGYALAGDL